MHWKKYRPVYLVLLVPLVYALLLRTVFDMDITSNFAVVMSLSFFISLPFAVGILTISVSPIARVKSRWYRIFMPWVPIFEFFIVTLFVKIEGWACWMMILPVFLIFSSIGGLVAGHFKIKKWKNENRLLASLVFLLPFVLASFENLLPAPASVYKAYTFIDIRAGREQIWNNVTRVKEISAADEHWHLTRFLGFPRPIKAELDFAGIGGSRKAIFSRGLIFNEVVTAYEPCKKMDFSIRANPYSIPSTTMDKHVVIGGDYFDVLNGSYRLEQLDGNTWRLHLFSNFQLKTTFNFYASWWAGQIMKDIQHNILQVIKIRSEQN